MLGPLLSFLIYCTEFSALPSWYHHSRHKQKLISALSLYEAEKKVESEVANKIQKSSLLLGVV